MSGNMERVKKAVDAGADVNFVNADGANSLAAAAFYPDIVGYLISKKADVNGGKSNPLQNASYYGAYETMKLLLDAGADPNKGTVLNTGSIYDNLIAAEKAKPKPSSAVLKIYEKMAKDAQANATFLY